MANAKGSEQVKPVVAQAGKALGGPLPPSAPPNRSGALSELKTSSLPIAKSRMRRETGRESIAARAGVAARMSSVSAAGPPPGTFARRKTGGLNFTSRPTQQSTRQNRFNDDASQQAMQKVLQAEEKAELFRKQAEELATRFQQMSSLSHGSESLREDVTDMKKMLEEVRKTAAQSNRASSAADIESMVKATEIRASLERQLDESNIRVRELQQRACSLEMQIVEKDGALNRAQIEHKTIEEERDFLLESVSAEKKAVIKLKASLDQAREDVESLEHKAEQDCEDMQKEHKEDAKKIAALTSEKQAVEQLQRNLEIEFQSAKSDIAQYRATMSSQEVAVASLRSQVTAAQVRIVDMEQKCENKDREIAALQGKISDDLANIIKLEEQAHTDENERRRLHNALQELKGNIRVFCRVRPLIGPEVDLNPEDIFQYSERGRGLSISKSIQSSESLESGSRGSGQTYNKKFTFDRVFGPASSQEDVFSEISQLVQSALDGYRVCIFAYGQTGSGKTHTIMGHQADLGMIPRSVQQVFDQAARLAKDQWKFEFRASFLEIYNETVADLLVQREKSRGGKAESYNIYYDPSTNESRVEGLTVVGVADPAAANKLMAQAIKNRSTAATKSNSQSSRSHSVFRMYIDGTNPCSGQTLKGILNLVDLAGSERIKVSGAEGDRLKETKAINKSLLQLSTVIQSLANNEAHIGYRNSKLTMLLRDSLGGDCKTLMFVNVAPNTESFNESLCSLRFAEKVNACEIGTAKRSVKINLLQDT
jgi:kinesin family member C1